MSSVRARLVCGSMAALLATSPALAFPQLPNQVPVPSARPDVRVETAAPSPTRTVVQISTTAQDIPPERLDVRVIGVPFLPDGGSTLSVASAQDGRTPLFYIEDAWRAVMGAILDRDSPDELDLAALSK